MQPAAPRIGPAVSIEESSTQHQSGSIHAESTRSTAIKVETSTVGPTERVPIAIQAELVTTDWVSFAKAVTDIDQALKVLSEGDFQGRWEIVKRFPDFGSSAIAPLIAAAQDEAADVEYRWFAIRSLGRFAAPDAITALGNLVTATDSDDLSSLAAEQLAGMGKQAVAALVPLLDHPAERLLAVKALGQIRQRSIIEPLLNVLNDPDPVLRQTVLEALGSFHDPRVTQALLSALNDTSSPVRKEAVITLGHRHDLCHQPAILRPLEQRLWDIDLEVCCQAAVAIGRLGLTDSLPALEQLMASVNTPELLLRHTVKSLSWFDTAEAQHILLKHYGQLPTPVQLEVVRRLGQLKTSPDQAVQFLLDRLSQYLQTHYLQAQHPQAPAEASSNVAIKRAIALSLGQLGDKAAFRSLVPLLADPNRQVQFHCLRALEQLASHSLEVDLEVILNGHTLPEAVQTQIEAHLETW